MSFTSTPVKITPEEIKKEIDFGAEVTAVSGANEDYEARYMKAEAVDSVEAATNLCSEVSPPATPVIHQHSHKNGRRNQERGWQPVRC